MLRMSKNPKIYLTAREAATELNVSRPTLYAYVSRGMIRSEPSENGRNRLYRAEDVRALRSRKTPSQGEETVARQSLNFGTPVMDSAITLIAENRLYYRGRDAVELAKSNRFEQVATMLWLQDETDPFVEPALDIAAPTGLPPLPCAVSLLSIAGERDLKGMNLSNRGVAETGARIARLLTSGFTGLPASDMPIHESLARAWGIDDAGADLIRMALILTADHELNASAFTVRCVASTRATPYSAICAGLSALQGPRHGGQTEQAIAFLHEIAAGPNASDAVMARLKRGEKLPGFGHPLYDEVDPRASAILAAMERNFGSIPALELARDIMTAATEAVGLGPNIDFALATLGHALGLPHGAPFATFAIGRSAGWVAHAQEQYRSQELIRPRARYVGDEPLTGGKPATFTSKADTYP